jgi:hypothetical protein
MEKLITLKELNRTIKNNRKLLEDLKLERERVRIGFLGGETPRLMALLTDTINVIETLTGEFIAGRRQLKRLKRLQKEKRELTEALEPQPKPTPIVKPLSKRQKKKAKRFKKSLSPSRRHNII